MYLNMLCKVTIGQIYFDHVKSITINESIEELSNTATIVVARFLKELDGKQVLDYIKTGDKVKIELGYAETGGLKPEFSGYVREVSRDLPLKIECDQMFPLRQNKFVKSYKNASLKQVLSDITQGTIITKVDAPDANMGKYPIDNASTFGVLQNIKETLGLFSTLSEDGVLRLGWAYDWKPNQTRSHTYNYGTNVKRSELKYKTKDGYDLKIRVKVRGKTGKEQYVEVGSKASNASVKTIDYAASTAEMAKKIAEAHYSKNVFDGYTGSITGFGIPGTRAGDSLRVEDPREPQQDGDYLISKVTIAWDESGGFSRTNELSFKL